MVLTMRELKSMEKMQEMIRESFLEPQTVFKHSTRCALSSVVLSRMQSFKEIDKVYIVDVIGQRELSNNISVTFNIEHQSPQLLIIHKGKCVYNNSHMGISASDVENQLRLLLS